MCVLSYKIQFSRVINNSVQNVANEMYKTINTEKTDNIKTRTIENIIRMHRQQKIK